MEFISEEIFGKYSKIKIVVLKWSNFKAFLRPSSLKTIFCKQKFKVGYVCIEESFNATLSMEKNKGAFFTDLVLLDGQIPSRVFSRVGSGSEAGFFSRIGSGSGSTLSVSTNHFFGKNIFI